MNHSKLKKYAQDARRGFMAAVEGRAAHCGLTADAIEPVQVRGTVTMIDGRAFPADVAGKRRKLEERIARQGFAAVVEAVAYTWFNRLAALRYMEIHGYLDHGYRVLSHPGDGAQPEILDHAEHVELPGVSRERVIELKLAGDKDAELYRLLLVGQCNALHTAMPFLFPPVGDETELLLPDNLLHSSSLLRQMVEHIAEDDWRNIEIVGWLYQYYISEKKDQVIGKVVKSEDIPAATQLFTPNWIVKYMVQNSLGAQWLATYPESGLRAQMEYYIEPAEQTDEVKAELATITPDSLDPEALTLIDPACGSGHILVEAYELFKAIYLERGYRPRDIARLILEKNLYGLDIDPRAAQMAGFALMMKGRADDRRLFDRGVRLNVLAFVDSDEFAADVLAQGVDLGEYGLEAGDLTALKQLFSHATTFGSLIQVPDKLAAKLPTITQLYNTKISDLFMSNSLQRLSLLARQAQLLREKYHVAVSNPPYMSAKSFNARLKSWMKVEYKDVDKDLFSAFIVRMRALSQSNGYLGVMTSFVWMFIRSFKRLRRDLIEKQTIQSLIQLHYDAFADAKAHICTFTLQNRPVRAYKSSYIRLADFPGVDIQAPRTLDAISDRKCGWFFESMQDDFRKIPGSPIAYWASSRIVELFELGQPLGGLAEPRVGLQTNDVNRFLRKWHEVSQEKISMGCESRNVAKQSSGKWFPHNKGGDFRKWYGNNEWLVNWEADGKEIYELARKINGSPSRTVRSPDFYFQSCLTWSDIASEIFAVRVSDAGYVFDISAPCIFPTKEIRLIVAGLLCSAVALKILKLLNSTIHFLVSNIASIPYLNSELTKNCMAIERIVSKAIGATRADWDAYERSWDFQSFPFLPTTSDPAPTLEASYTAWIARNRETIAEMKRLEEENNRLFIDAYGLQDELTPDVPIEQITLTVNPAYRYGSKLTDDERWTRFRTDTMKELISYAIGCMMGRYSLDAPGLIYAHSGNQGFDPDKYQTFPADDDGIIPITDTDWFADDATNRVVEFIRTAWSPDHRADNLADNLADLAEALGAKKNEQPTDTIRRYLARDFFKDHLRTYKKRPIYWLFSSGKQGAFACLVYLHRYHEGTLARMRTEYVIPLLGKLATRMEQIRADRDAATSTAHRRKLDKRLGQLEKQRDELRGFDEKLRNRADQRIALDLDDGVKVNYGKFGDLLAGVKDVTGKKPAK